MRTSALQSLVHRLLAARSIPSCSGETVRTFAAFRKTQDGLPLEIAKSENQEIKGVKTVLFGILRNAEGPLTSAQIWEIAEGEGVKSKRFMKQMLSDMRKARHLKTLKEKGATHFSYLLPEKLPPPPELPPKVELKPWKKSYVQEAA